MAAGKQDETIIVQWHPGDTTGYNGLGVSGQAVPTNRDDTEATSRAAVNTRVSTLSTRLVASGVLPTGV